MEITHPLAPVYDENSKILILGTMPSPKSRENGFYYTHPQNKFWRILSDLFSERLPLTNEERRALLLRNYIALWDVLARCDIQGAHDSSIKEPVANDLNLILNAAPINAVFTTGGKAAMLYKKYCYPKTGIEAVALPSTSPANCGHPYNELLKDYEKITDYLNK